MDVSFEGDSFASPAKIIIFTSNNQKHTYTTIMADNRKEVERAELHRTIWAIADDLRGSVDGWDFKSYILGM